MESIRLRKIYVHNLKGIDLDIPHKTLTVITGLSGSGKSSLAFDTLFAEGQSRYIETFPPYIRQFLLRVEKPKAESIEGMLPAIAVEQDRTTANSRSTVATMTGIADYLKILYARLSVPICPRCHQPIQKSTPKGIVEQLFRSYLHKDFLICYPVRFAAHTSFREASQLLLSQGYSKIWLGNQIVRIDEEPTCSSLMDFEEILVIHSLEKVEYERESQLLETFEESLKMGKGTIQVVFFPENKSLSFSNRLICPVDKIEFEEPLPALFSFNNPKGACPTCHGFGRIITIDYDKVIPEKNLSVEQGAIRPFQSEHFKHWQIFLERMLKKRKISLTKKIASYNKAEWDYLVQGEDPSTDADLLIEQDRWCGIDGFFSILEKKTYQTHIRVFLSRYRLYTQCPDCQGSRFNKKALGYKVFSGQTPLSIGEFLQLPITELIPIVSQIDIPVWDKAALKIIEELGSRLRYLDDIGLGYLTLDRTSRTLSGGETRRANLTICLGNKLTNTLFVLDEPTIGLHPKDSSRLVELIKKLRDQGNTIVVVEHDETVIKNADYIVELGPGTGSEGGKVTYSGNLQGLLSSPSSLTGAYLSRRKTVEIPQNRRKPSQDRLQVRKANIHNLQNLDVDIPLGLFVTVTGVSGCGKSSLVHEIIAQGLHRIKELDPPQGTFFTGRAYFNGWENIGEVIEIDQMAILKTPRSNIALYLGIWQYVRKLFASTDQALTQGIGESSFSMNSGEGRCPRCLGLGYEKIEMQFLADVYVCCSVCGGKRFQPHILAIRYQGKSVDQILEMTAKEASLFFTPQKSASGPQSVLCKKIVDRLEMLKEIGLDYLQLGHPLSQLSGGESQRLKILSILCESPFSFPLDFNKKTRKTSGGQHRIVILDEPTTGLHMDDVSRLIGLLQKLVDRGNTLIVVEHNLDVILSSDWVIDLGPSGGKAGGKIVAQGPPESIAQSKQGFTAFFLNEKLNNKSSFYLSPMTPSSAAVKRQSLSIRGARHHNLKSISLEIDLEKTTVLTGMSGSGKSTLAFDVLFAESRRRFLDSLSGYARQFIQSLEKPQVDDIEWLPPSIAIEQRSTIPGAKSTVGTLSGIYPFLRLLFAKTGVPFDPDTHEEAIQQNPKEILNSIRSKLLADRTYRVLAPLVRERKGIYSSLGKWAQKKGYLGFRIDGDWYEAVEFPRLSRFKNHTLDLWLCTLNGGSVPEDLEKNISLALNLGQESVILFDETENKDTLYSTKFHCPQSGKSFDALDPRLFSFHSPLGWCPTCLGNGKIEEKTGQDSILCPDCQGKKINRLARSVFLPWPIHGLKPTIDHLCSLPIDQLINYFQAIEPSFHQKAIVEKIIPELIKRLQFITQVGLHYLSLDREAQTLSAGELQRLHLCSQLGSNLQGILYILDEPTIGLHPTENQKLLDSLEELKNKGNTLVIVEHDTETMKRADKIIDLGPGAGAEGGKIIFEGSYAELLNCKNSITSRYLSQPMSHPLKGNKRRSCDDHASWLKIYGINVHNLKNVELELPLGRFVVICGVSGSGKSTLLKEVIFAAVKKTLQKSRGQIQNEYWTKVIGTEALSDVCFVDQTPIGKNSRSTPLTYLGLFDIIRELYAQTPLSRQRGYTKSRFSYNSKEGSCPDCQGNGTIQVSMPLLPLFYLPCESCEGKRYNPQTLEVRYKDKSIYDILCMTAAEACSFFCSIEKLRKPLSILCDIGLSYLQLGQPTPTLSGGEAQRIKLAKELIAVEQKMIQRELFWGSANEARILYLLEEPTIGLHLADIEKFLHLCQRLVEFGHTVVIIEHHPDVIAEADYVIELGPGAGERGGKIIGKGAPEHFSRTMNSPTAPFLKEILS
ncbi:excinuclease ABC subunit UvrA [Methylacidiphilum caldifontis]|uniref:excinuclease ABC subunit UvrA n=1 Tax=Methylacidiphilum caldifontis TaxID=2795386 RepID=UPI001A8CE0C5|nr:excinuclease ABC subunit UvrA [Methylacidiphilum caldifontis]QSR87860.1 excinuclease ABC subunit UvrA [Methylacidiphilum caldifontis]